MCHFHMCILLTLNSEQHFNTEGGVQSVGSGPISRLTVSFVAAVNTEE